VTIIGIDDTDSRTRGMCTTYLAARLADRLRGEGATVHRVLLVRLNPAVEHKTRGNAALAIHTSMGRNRAMTLASAEIEAAETEDPDTNPGVVVGENPSQRVREFARMAVRDYHEIADAKALIAAERYDEVSRGNGRGLIGALAAVGAWDAFDEWTCERITYRERDAWGTPRDVDEESVFAAADRAYPDAWDTVDTVERDAVCVPHTPGPVLYGIRGDDPDVVAEVTAAIESEPGARRETFWTNQGTDAHLQDGTVSGVRDGYAYRVDGQVVDEPETRAGGHVFFTIGDGTSELACAAFEPTKRFRTHVRALREGDEVTVCGEVADGTLKLEKFAVRERTQTELVTPKCESCGRKMESAGRGQGYRCRDCDTSAPGKVAEPIERELEPGWYEVPPCARRHIARPLVRGGFDGPTHPVR
jgi:tRNA(Ile2)-agmatinylcytidine synthase